MSIQASKTSRPGLLLDTSSDLGGLQVPTIFSSPLGVGTTLSDVGGGNAGAFLTSQSHTDNGLARIGLIDRFMWPSPW